MNRVVTHLQGCLIHAQRHDERDNLADDVGRDRVVRDDERRALRLKQELTAIAVEPSFPSLPSSLSFGPELDSLNFLSVLSLLSSLALSCGLVLGSLSAMSKPV